MLKTRVFPVFIMFVFCAVSCKQPDNTEKILSSVENIVAQYPDSALSLLESLHGLDSSNAADYNKFLLLQIQAKDKAYKDITGDTAIFRVRDYYKGKNDVGNLALASFYCGRVLQDQQEDTLAISEYLQAGEYAEHTEDNALKGLIENSIGAVLLKELAGWEALNHLLKSAQYFQKAKHTRNEIIAYNQIGNAYLIESKNDSAFYYYRKGLELAKVTNDSLQMSVLTHCLGIAYQETGELDLAEKYIRKASEYANDKDNEIKWYLNLSETFYERNMLDSAKVYADKSLSLLPDNEEPFVAAEIYLVLSRISEKQSDLRQSLDYLKQYTGNIEKIVSGNESKEILELQEKYNNERLQNENNRLKVKSQQIRLLVSITVSVLCFIALFFYIRSVKKKREILKKSNELLQINNELLQTKERIIEMAEYYQSKAVSHKDLLRHRFEILKRIALLKSQLREDDEPSQRLIIRIYQIVYEQDSINWAMLYQDMNEIYDGLFDYLKEQYPALEEDEFRICCLAYAGFSCCESGAIMECSYHTIEKKRLFIRKKLGIQSKGSISDFLDHLLSS